MRAWLLALLLSTAAQAQIGQCTDGFPLYVGATFDTCAASLQFTDGDLACQGGRCSVDLGVYPRSAGVAGGQTLVGGTADTDDLTLQSTASGTPSDLGSDLVLDAPGVEFLPGTRAMTAVEGLGTRGDITLASGGSHWGIYLFGTLNLAGPPTIGPYQFVTFETIQPTAAGVSIDPVAFTNDTQFDANGQTDFELRSTGAFRDHPGLTLNAGTFDSASTYTSFESLLTPGTGVTWPSRRGFVFRQEDGAGSINTQIGFQVDDLTSNTASTGFLSLLDTGLAFDAQGDAPSRFAAPLIGGTTATDSLALRPSSAADYTGNLGLCGGAGDIGTTQGVECVELYPDGLTMGLVAAAGTGSVAAVRMQSTITQDSAGFVGLPQVILFQDAHVQAVTDSALNITTGSGLVSFESAPILRNATDDNQTEWSYVGFRANPTFEATSSGTHRGDKSDNFSSGRPAISTGATVLVHNDFIALGGGAVDGTLTTRHMFLAEAPGAGTNRAQYAAAEHTITGTVPTGEGWWGVEAGAPNTFYFKNEAGTVFRLPTDTPSDGHQLTWNTDGTTSWDPAGGGAGALTLLQLNGYEACGASTQYMGMAGGMGCGAETSVDSALPADITVTAMTCGAPVDSSCVLTFTLRDDAAGTAATCTSTNGAGCTVGSLSVAVASGSLVAVELVDTAANCSANLGVGCVVEYTP